MKKTVLIYECAGGHGECLPSYYYYFNKLGFDVSFILDKKVADDKPLWMLNKINTKVIITPAHDIEKHIKEVSYIGNTLFRYDFYFIATLNKYTYPFVQYLLANGIKKYQIMFQNHLNKEYFLKNSNNAIDLIKNGFVLTQSEDFPSLPPIKNISNMTTRAKISSFDKLSILITGLDKIHFSYFEKFIKVVDKLNANGKDIKVKVTGIRRRGGYVLPKSENLTYCGRVDFEELTRLYVTNDFLMTFFDSNAQEYKSEHDSFLKGRTSGSRNSSVIFGIPLLVQKPYQISWKMDESNSISYQNTNYEQLLLSLFDIEPQKYNDIIKNLAELQNIESNLCIQNLKNKINCLCEEKLPDLVYIVKEDENNEDLRYSLRSVDKFVPHNKVWIIGYKPSWIYNVNYLPVAQKDTKWKNSVNNILTACKCDDISDNFILMNDDFFAIKPIKNIFESINVSLGLLENMIEKQKAKKFATNWGKAFIYIGDLLREIGLDGPYYNYESHTPFLINKEKYLEVMNLPSVQKFMQTSKVLHKRTLYGNYVKMQTKILPKDVKILQKQDDTESRAQFCDWISVYDNQIGNKLFPQLNSLFKTLFSEPCKYEIKPENTTQNNNIQTAKKRNKYF